MDELDSVVASDAARGSTGLIYRFRDHARWRASDGALALRWSTNTSAYFSPSTANSKVWRSSPRSTSLRSEVNPELAFANLIRGSFPKIAARAYIGNRLQLMMARWRAFEDEVLLFSASRFASSLVDCPSSVQTSTTGRRRARSGVAAAMRVSSRCRQPPPPDDLHARSQLRVRSLSHPLEAEKRVADQTADATGGSLRA